MNNYFSLTIEEQRQVLQAVEGRIGLPAQAIEKDFREDIISIWEKDYTEMLVNMIYGSNKPTFKQIIEKMQVLQDRIRQ